MLSSSPLAFNRTIVELKQVRGWQVSGCGLSFNRTIVELKLTNVVGQLIATVTLLIEPLWN